MGYATAFIETEVDINLDQFDTEDLLKELESRGIVGGNSQLMIDLENLYNGKILSQYSGLTIPFEEKLDEFFRTHLGKGL